jgi:hypothetical protein
MMIFFKRLFARLFGRRRGPAEEPLAGVREPRTRKPGGRSSAVAVMEPETPRSVLAIGSRRR